MDSNHHVAVESSKTSVVQKTEKTKQRWSATPAWDEQTHELTSSGSIHTDEALIQRESAVKGLEDELRVRDKLKGGEMWRMEQRERKKTEGEE